MTRFEDFLKAQLCDPELKTEYDTLEPEFSIIQEVINTQAKKETVDTKQENLFGCRKKS